MLIAIPLSEILSPLSFSVWIAGMSALIVVAVFAWIRIQGVRLAQRREMHQQEMREREHLAYLAEAEGKREREFKFHRDAPAWDPAPDADPRDRARISSEGPRVLEPLESAVADLQFRFAVQDLDIEDDSVRLTRFLPVSVYVNSDDPSDFYELHDAMARLLQEFGFDVASELQLKRGSIFQKLTGKLRDPATREELQYQAELAQLALQQKALGLTQAEINTKQAQAAAEVHRILDAHEEYVIVIGSLVGVTHQEEDGTRRSAIVELTPAELIEFQRTGGALSKAEDAFRLVSEMHPESVLRPQHPQLRAGEAPRLPPSEGPP
jgi:hypothetical protein